MINIEELKIGNKIISENPINTWRIYVDVMHGDADKYETNKIDFPDHPNKEWGLSYKDLALYIDVINNYFETKGSKREFSEIYKIIESVHKDEKDIDGLCDRYTETLFVGDCTCDHQYIAKIMNVKITRFDENGVEYNVEIPKGIKCQQ